MTDDARSSTDPVCPINRLDVDDGWATFVSTAGYRMAEALGQYESHLVLDRRADTVRIATATHIGDATTFELRGPNVVYYETPVVERDLTDAEIAWCEDTFMYAGDRRPDTVCEMTFPAPEALRSAALDGDLDRYDDLTATIQDPDERDRVVREIQREIERNRYRKNKLHPREGYPEDGDTLDPEWHPDDGEIWPIVGDDADTQRVLYESAVSRADTATVNWETVTGLAYHRFREARCRIHRLDGYTHVEPRHFVATDLLGHEEQEWCQYCATLRHEDLMLRVEVPLTGGRTRTERVCDRCAERKRDYGPDHTYTDEQVAAAMDRRAQRLDEGQRRLAGDYGTEDTDD